MSLAFQSGEGSFAAVYSVLTEYRHSLTRTDRALLPPDSIVQSVSFVSSPTLAHVARQTCTSSQPLSSEGLRGQAGAGRATATLAPRQKTGRSVRQRRAQAQWNPSK